MHKVTFNNKLPFNQLMYTEWPFQVPVRNLQNALMTMKVKERPFIYCVLNIGVQLHKIICQI